MWFVFVKEYFFFPLDPHLLQAGVVGQVQRGRSYQAPGAAVVGCVLAMLVPKTACRTDGLRVPSKSGSSSCVVHAEGFLARKSAAEGHQPWPRGFTHLPSPWQMSAASVPTGGQRAVVPASRTMEMGKVFAKG